MKSVKKDLSVQPEPEKKGIWKAHRKSTTIYVKNAAVKKTAEKNSALKEKVVVKKKMKKYK